MGKTGSGWGRWPAELEPKWQQGAGTATHTGVKRGGGRVQPNVSHVTKTHLLQEGCGVFPSEGDRGRWVCPLAHKCASPTILHLLTKPLPLFLRPALLAQVACSVGLASGWRLAAGRLDGLTEPSPRPKPHQPANRWRPILPNLRQRRQRQSESDPSEGGAGMPSSPLEQYVHFIFASLGSGPIGLEQISNRVENRNFQPQKATLPPEGFTV